MTKTKKVFADVATGLSYKGEPDYIGQCYFNTFYALLKEPFTGTIWCECTTEQIEILEKEYGVIG